MRQMESRQDKPDEFQLKALKTDEWIKTNAHRDAYCTGKRYRHIRVMSDNITAISCVSDKGWIKSNFCNEIYKWSIACYFF